MNPGRQLRPAIAVKGGGIPAAFSRPAAADLRYVSDSEPGITRLRRRGSFRYVSPAGTPVRDGETLRRIRSLAIPPAYEDVWICTDPTGHIQATARDARGRKQYRYHAAWRAIRDATKFDRMAEFGRALPRIRAGIARDLESPGLTRERVLATVVQLLEGTLVRVGNEEYARENGSFGLTTLREGHVRVCPQAVRLRFRGKSGIEHDVTVSDRRVVKVIRRCLELPGQDLFRWLDDAGEPRPIGSSDVNAYLRELARGDFTAKDFRTWSASVMALELLAQRRWKSVTQARREVAAVVKEVAARLGNTPTVCRNCYIHPMVIASFLEPGPAALGCDDPTAPPDLQPPERRFLALIAHPEAGDSAASRRGARRGQRSRRASAIAIAAMDRRRTARRSPEIAAS